MARHWENFKLKIPKGKKEEPMKKLSLATLAALCFFIVFMTSGCAEKKDVPPVDEPVKPVQQSVAPPTPPPAQSTLQYEDVPVIKSVTVTGDATRAPLMASLIRASRPDTKVEVNIDNKADHHVWVKGPAGSEKVMMSNALLRNISKEKDKSMASLCPEQLAQAEKAIGLNETRQQVKKSVAPASTAQFTSVTTDPNCPTGNCGPSLGGNCYLTEKATPGKPYDVAYCDNPMKPKGSVASKVTGGRVQIVIYNGEANPFLLERAISRAIRLASRLDSYPKTGTCDYHLHTITSPDGP